MSSVLEISKYITSIKNVDNLQLNKLLYYSQAIYMILNKKKKLFEDKIEAWQYGPVVPSVYKKYKKYGLEKIKENSSTASLNSDEIKSIDIVLDFYGKKTGIELMLSTHQEDPWLDAYDPQKNNEITPDAIFKYFKKNITFSR